MVTSKESQKAYIIQRVIENKISPQKAAGLLNFSTRHIRRLILNVKKEGKKALIHKARGKKAHNCISLAIQKRIVHLYTHQYQKLSPTCFTQRLNKDESIKISKESVRKILIRHGCWVYKARKKLDDLAYDRLLDRGAVVQMHSIAGSWFDQSGAGSVLIYLMDEASFEIYAKFYPYEGYLSVLDALFGYIQKYGIPLSLNVEAYQTLQTHHKSLMVEEQLNNVYPMSIFEKAVLEIGIQVKYVHLQDSNAGDIDVFLKDFQDKLKKTLMYQKVTNITRANRVLKPFLIAYNKKDLHQKNIVVDRHKKGLSSSVLKKMLVIKHECYLDQHNHIYWQNHVFKILEPVEQKKVFLIQSIDQGFYIRDIKGKHLKFKLIKKQSLFLHHHRKKPSIFVHVNPFSLKEIYI